MSQSIPVYKIKTPKGTTYDVKGNQLVEIVRKARDKFGKGKVSFEGYIKGDR